MTQLVCAAGARNGAASRIGHAINANRKKKLFMAPHTVLGVGTKLLQCRGSSNRQLPMIEKSLFFSPARLSQSCAPVFAIMKIVRSGIFFDLALALRPNRSEVGYARRRR